MSQQRKLTANLDHLVLGVPDLDTSVKNFAQTLGATPTLGGDQATSRSRQPLRKISSTMYA